MGRRPGVGSATLADMSKQVPSVPHGPMSERTFWAWLLVASGVACWLIAAWWVVRAHLTGDTDQNIYSGFGLGFFILGLGPLCVALAMGLRRASAGRNPEV